MMLYRRHFDNIYFVLIVLISKCMSESFPTSYKYLLADFQRCHMVKPDVLIWVQGRADSIHIRSMMRLVYGDLNNWPEKTRVLMIFFVGRPSRQSPKTLQRILEYEFEQYSDIVQADYGEDYRNQTSKMISAINFISDYCSSASLIIRMDDDVLFHPKLVIPKIIQLIAKKEERRFNNNLLLKDLGKSTVACRLISDFGVWRLRDHPGHFYAVDDSVLPNRVLYPPFCAGFFIAMSGNVPSLLQQHLASIKPFWMDDRYMGVLQEKAKISNIDISRRLDFGYADITHENLALLPRNKTIAKHLPGKFKYHLTQLFIYVDLATKGLRGHFYGLKY